MEKKFIKVRTINNLFISVSLIITGFIFVIIPQAVEAHRGGYTLIAIGAILACFLKSGYKDLNTKEKYLKKELSFPINMKTSILTALAKTPELIDLSQEGKSETLVLRIYYSKSSGKAYLQLLEFVPHQYEPCSQMYEFEINKITNILK